MIGYAARQLALLRPVYADRWDIWYVLCFPNGYVWCAKPAGTPVATINASSPEELIAAIRRAEES
jgi:hypothetical protein